LDSSRPGCVVDAKTVNMRISEFVRINKFTQINGGVNGFKGLHQ